MKQFFEKGGKLERFYPIYEMFETMFFVQPNRTTSGAHIRDSVDIKRVMAFVIIAAMPLFLFGIYNAGYQHYLSMGQTASMLEYMLKGGVIVFPLLIVSYGVGGFWEILFAIVRKHEINEGLFVTGFFIPLIVPPTIPLWQVALAVSFGVVLGKEVFGGTGMNVFNPALVARAFLFFSYPASISGDSVWTDFGSKIVDAYTKATPLSIASASKGTIGVVDLLNAKGYSLWNMFTGFIPGSIGETSTLLILLGGIFLLITGVASWRIMASVFAGGYLMGLVFNLVATSSSSIMAIPPYYHFVMGGFAFGAVFMATDPVSAAATNVGKYIYGVLIGILAVLIRVLNPAYPEGMMLAILFMNTFAPLIDNIVVWRNVQRRLKRATK